MLVPALYTLGARLQVWGQNPLPDLGGSCVNALCVNLPLSPYWFNPYKLWNDTVQSPHNFPFITNTHLLSQPGLLLLRPYLSCYRPSKKPLTPVLRSELEHRPPFSYSCLWRAACGCLRSTESARVRTCCCLPFVPDSIPIPAGSYSIPIPDGRRLRAVTQRATRGLKALHASAIAESGSG